MQIASDIMRVTAPNPSPMTATGTQSYLIGSDRLTIIDPGPDRDAHLTALSDAIDGRPVDRIFVTHAHLDHSGLARKLADATGAPLVAFGPAHAGQSAIMQVLAQSGSLEGGEGIDQDFIPDMTVTDGQVIGDFTVFHTPGHIGNHICIGYREVLFSGDHVLGWSSTFVSPPDGDLTDFMASCAKLRDLPYAMMLPGHGDPVTDPKGRIDVLMRHRKSRESQIIESLRDGPGTVTQVTAKVYAKLPDPMKRAAARNVLAHLIALEQAGQVAVNGPHSTQNAVYRLT